MANRDRTGPNGLGPLTGRGFGPCDRGVGYGKGAGSGWGRGFGWRNRVPVSAPSKEEEIEMLKREKTLLEEDLKSLSERIKSLEG